MRLGYDSKRFFYNLTGLGNYSRDTVRVLTNYYSKNKYFLYTPREKNNNRLKFLEERKNIFIRTPFSYIGNLLTKYWRTTNIVKDLVQDEIEIYHGLSNELPIGIEKTNIKSIVTIHDLIFIRYPKLFSIIDRKIYYRKFKSACNRATKIIAISQQTKEDIIKYFNIEQEKIHVVYQGCNNVFQKEMNSKIKKDVCEKYNLPSQFLLNVSSIEERKNQLLILKSLNHLNGENLVLIGDGNKYKKKCIEYIKKNNLQNRVTIISNINQIEMSAIYQSAKIMVYPSFYEGFGIPILEALFCKIPVITSNGSCFSETGGENSVYINPNEITELVSAIKIINSDKKIQIKMSEEGYKHAQAFTDEKVAKNLMKVYRRL